MDGWVIDPMVGVDSIYFDCTSVPQLKKYWVNPLESGLYDTDMLEDIILKA